MTSPSLNNLPPSPQATTTIVNNNNNKISNDHSHFAGRRPAGTNHPITLTKNGVYHTQRMPKDDDNNNSNDNNNDDDSNNERVREIIACGLACSEVFSGVNLARILQPGFALEQQVMLDLAAGKPATPLSIHTSCGVTEALGPFLEALEYHLPWPKKNNKQHEELDWCVSLQLEGASAVWAAIDMVLQTLIMENPSQNQNRIKVAVGATSYHGPPSTSFGANSPLWNKNHNQLIYPVPTAYGTYDEMELLQKYTQFLDDHAHEIGCILFEPQWGSSQAALPWPEHLLKTYVRMARERGIKIVCDEIMCGLGRHGKGTLFVSEAWELDPDAVTFGKAVATGLFPLAGAILKQGRNLLHRNKCSVMQSHTYAGSSTRALMAATEVLKEFVIWLPSVAHLGEEMAHIMRYLTKTSEGMFVCHGQGLMWGGIVTHVGQNADASFRASVVQAFKKHCEDMCIIPYFVPVGGFMVSPVIDIDVATIYEIGERLEQAIVRTMKEVGWVGVDAGADATTTASEENHQPVSATPAAIASASSLNLAALAASQEKMAQAGELANRRWGSLLMVQDLGNDKCVPYLHATKCCTACGSFVHPTVRTKFMSMMTGSFAKPVGETVVYDQFGETEGSEDGKTEPSTTSVASSEEEEAALAF